MSYRITKSNNSHALKKIQHAIFERDRALTCSTLIDAYLWRTYRRRDSCVKNSLRRGLFERQRGSEESSVGSRVKKQTSRCVYVALEKNRFLIK